MGGFKTGGTNFDAKVRRESLEPVDLFYAYIGGMDAFARGLKIAAAIRKDGRLADFVKQRYSSWDSGIGAKIEAGKARSTTAPDDEVLRLAAEQDRVLITCNRNDFLTAARAAAARERPCVGRRAPEPRQELQELPVDTLRQS